MVVKDSKGNVIPSSEYYAGKMTGECKVLPKNTKLIKLSADSKSFWTKWNKQTKEVTGYQIRYSLKKNMNKAKKRYRKEYESGIL